VRRSLAADHGSTGTICGASALDEPKDLRNVHVLQTQDDGNRLDDGSRRRVEMLEELFGVRCTKPEFMMVSPSV
jgi:hypothetical protein